MKFIDLFAGIGGFRYGLQKVEIESESSSDNESGASRHSQRAFHCVWSNEWDKYANQIYTKHFGECDSRDIRTVDTKDIPDHDLLCAGFPCQSFSIAGKTFQTILGVLSDLGYEYQWQVLNSKNFGVPQNRERVFIVGHLRETSRPE